MPVNQKGIAPIFILILALALSGIVAAANIPVTQKFQSFGQILGEGSGSSGSDDSKEKLESGLGAGSASNSGSGSIETKNMTSEEIKKLELKKIIPEIKKDKIKEIEKKKVENKEDKEEEFEDEDLDLSDLEEDLEDLKSTELRSREGELEVEFNEEGSKKSKKGKGQKIKIKVKGLEREKEVEFKVFGDLLEFEASGEAALSRFPLSLNQEGELFVRTGNGLKQIRVLPDKAAEIARQVGVQTQIDKIELIENTPEEVLFKVSGAKKGRLFGLFEVKGETETEINAKTGVVSNTKQPFWMWLLSSLIK